MPTKKQCKKLASALLNAVQSAYASDDFPLPAQLIADAKTYLQLQDDPNVAAVAVDITNLLQRIKRLYNLPDDVRSFDVFFWLYDDFFSSKSRLLPLPSQQTNQQHR
jgi:hypothetical protein